MNNIELVNDKTVAEILSLSLSWVRKQRFLRRKGEPHLLDIDPIMIGTSPRYSLAELTAWTETLTNNKEN